MEYLRGFRPPDSHGTDRLFLSRALEAGPRNLRRRRQLQRSFDDSVILTLSRTYLYVHYLIYAYFAQNRRLRGSGCSTGLRESSWVSNVPYGLPNRSKGQSRARFDDELLPLPNNVALSA